MYSFSWVDKKQRRINLIKKKDNKCFQKAPTVVLNYEEIKTYLQRIKKINFL